LLLDMRTPERKKLRRKQARILAPLAGKSPMAAQPYVFYAGPVKVPRALPV
jgi:hypothetical protein